MGRELKRVPLNFEWPINEVWEGFLNPHYKGHSSKCLVCDGSGSSPQAKHLHNVWYGYVPFDPFMSDSEPFTSKTPEVRAFAQRNVSHDPVFYGSDEGAIDREAERLCSLFNSRWHHHLTQADVDALVKADRLYDFTRTPRTDAQREVVRKKVESGHNSWLPKSNGYHPKAREVNLWSIAGMGHDSLNAGIVIQARCEANKWPTMCEVCNGEGEVWDTPENKRTAEQWKAHEPPKGEGYQIWETVSEGSPISPVFASPEELADWMSENNRGVDRGTTREQWLAFIRGPGWAPSFLSSVNGIGTGVQVLTKGVS